MLTTEQKQTLSDMVIEDRTFGDIFEYVESLLAAERERGIEECAVACKTLADTAFGSGTLQHYAALQCEAAIRALKGK